MSIYRVVVSSLAVQVTTLIPKHMGKNNKALTETSTAVATIRFQLHSLCRMSSFQFQFAINFATIVSLAKNWTNKAFLLPQKTEMRAPKSPNPDTHLLHTVTPINVTQRTFGAEWIWRSPCKAEWVVMSCWAGRPYSAFHRGEPLVTNKPFEHCCGP